MYTFFVFIYWFILQHNSVDLFVDKVSVVNEELSIEVRIVNNSKNPIAVYKPTLESMIDGILYVELFDCNDSSNYHDLYPFEIIRDVEEIYITSQNTIVLNNGESFITNIKVPSTFKKGKYNVCVGLNYEDTKFVFKEMLTTDNILHEDLRFCKTVKLK